MNGSDNQMHTPAFKWEWNLNTIAILITFAGGLIAGGYFINDTVQVNADQNRDIGRLDVRVDRMADEMRMLPNHELRLSAAERLLTDAGQNMRAVQETAGELKSDVRVIREIVQRIEASQRRNGTATD